MRSHGDGYPEQYARHEASLVASPVVGRESICCEGEDIAIQATPVRT